MLTSPIAATPHTPHTHTYLNTELDVTPSLQSSGMHDLPTVVLTGAVEVPRAAEVIRPDVVVEETHRNFGLITCAAQSLLLFHSKILIFLIVTGDHRLFLIGGKHDSALFLCEEYDYNYTLIC